MLLTCCRITLESLCRYFEPHKGCTCPNYECQKAPQTQREVTNYKILKPSSVFLCFFIQILTSESSPKQTEISQSDTCTTEMLEELREKVQMANVTISEKNEIIEELSRNNTLLERNAILLEDKFEQKDEEMAKLTAHLSFMGLDQGCS